jgi:hypothetical protein
MNKLILVITLAVLTSACNPQEMNDNNADVIKSCLDKGWVPSYRDNGLVVSFKCVPRDYVK